MSGFRLRRAVRGVAVMVLAAILVGTLHLPTAQDACVPAGPEHHDESKHAFAPLGEQSHNHCAICHWQRLQRPGLTQLPLEIAALLSCVELTGADAARPNHNSFNQLPARAPPATV